MTGTRIAIGICTFRRPGIAATLASLGALRWPEGMSGLVIVADNDETPSARETVHAAAKGLPLPVCYLHAPARNISVARNAILEAAGARGLERLAFLDDDEMVEPGWIEALTEALARTAPRRCWVPCAPSMAPRPPPGCAKARSTTRGRPSCPTARSSRATAATC